MIITGKLHGSSGIRGYAGTAKIRTLSVKDAHILDVGGLLHHGYELRYFHNGEWWRVRVSGKLRTWKRDPNRIELPVKYGLYESVTLTSEDFNAYRVGIIHHSS